MEGQAEVRRSGEGGTRQARRKAGAHRLHPEMEKSHNCFMPDIHEVHHKITIRRTQRWFTARIVNHPDEGRNLGVARNVMSTTHGLQWSDQALHIELERTSSISARRHSRPQIGTRFYHKSTINPSSVLEEATL